jgi:hypothetical protein
VAHNPIRLIKILSLNSIYFKYPKVDSWKWEFPYVEDLFLAYLLGLLANLGVKKNLSRSRHIKISLVNLDSQCSPTFLSEEAYSWVAYMQKSGFFWISVLVEKVSLIRYGAKLFTPLKTDQLQRSNCILTLKITRTVVLWCRSLKHHYLCAKIPQPSNDDHFLIPLIETLLLVM